MLSLSEIIKIVRKREKIFEENHPKEHDFTLAELHNHTVMAEFNKKLSDAGIENPSELVKKLASVGYKIVAI